MTINEAAIRLLSYFSPEERSIPDSGTYPGRNGAVIGALNASLQLLFTKGGPWVRKDERGTLLNAPTQVSITVSNGSALASISTGWASWMEGCSIIIDGHDTDNQIRKINTPVAASVTINPTGADNSISYTAYAAGEVGNDITITYATPSATAETAVAVVGNAITVTPGTKARMVISGVSTPGVNGTLIYAGLFDGFPSWTSDGAEAGGATQTLLIGYNDTEWQLYKTTSGVPDYLAVAGQAPLTYPDGVTFSAPTGGDGTATIAAATSSAQQVITAVNASTPAAALVIAAASGTVTGAVAAVAETSLSGGTGGQTLKIPYGGTSEVQTATVYQDSITIGDDVLEVNDPVKANGLELRGMVAGGGPSQRTEINDYGAAGFVTNPSQAPVSSTGQPFFYSVTTWTKDATTPDRLRMSISPAPDVAGTLTYDVLLLPPEVTDLASTSALPIPFGMADSVFMPIAIMKLFGTPFFRDQQASQSVVDQYQLAMQQLGGIDPQKKSPTFTTLG